MTSLLALWDRLLSSPVLVSASSLDGALLLSLQVVLRSFSSFSGPTSIEEHHTKTPSAVPLSSAAAPAPILRWLVLKREQGVPPDWGLYTRWYLRWRCTYSCLRSSHSLALYLYPPLHLYLYLSTPHPFFGVVLVSVSLPVILRRVTVSLLASLRHCTCILPASVLVCTSFAPPSSPSFGVVLVSVWLLATLCCTSIPEKPLRCPVLVSDSLALHSRPSPESKHIFFRDTRLTGLYWCHPLGFRVSEVLY